MAHSAKGTPPPAGDEKACHRPSSVELCEVTQHNWRACADLDVEDSQQTYVAPVTRYLALCAYDDGPWKPAALTANNEPIGFVMHAVDPTDHSFWVGGLVIGQTKQRRGYGRAAMQALIDRARQGGHPNIALSYQPTNNPARALYTALGFVETGETEDHEVVARLILNP